MMAQGRKTGGRQSGTPNKITAAFKDAVRIVYDDIGRNEAFSAWAKENPGDFYRIASRLIPSEIASREGAAITIRIIDPIARRCIDVERDALPAPEETNI